jgi:hypothetical protein
MAELLLNQHARARLKIVLDGKECPADVDRTTYIAIQRGERSAVSLRKFAAILQAHGDSVSRAISGLKS